MYIIQMAKVFYKYNIPGNTAPGNTAGNYVSHTGNQQLTHGPTYIFLRSIQRGTKELIVSGRVLWINKYSNKVYFVSEAVLCGGRSTLNVRSLNGEIFSAACLTPFLSAVLYPLSGAVVSHRGRVEDISDADSLFGAPG